MSVEWARNSSLIARDSSLTLANGARAVLVARPRSPTFALQLLVRAGSRHDGGRPGLAHLVEHLVFRASGEERPDLFAAVESLGGEVTATTGRDYTAFSLVVAAPDALRALALLPALARAPATGPAHVRAERRIVGHELRERTRPADALWDLLLAALWADDPLARPPGGSLAALPRLTVRAAAGFHARHYTAPRLLAVAVGAGADDESFAGSVHAALATLPGDSAEIGAPASPAAHPAALEAPWGGPGCYVAVGTGVPGVEHADGAALSLLEVVLGQGPGSRLSRALAARGLPAVVQTRYAAYAGVGVFAALAAGPFSDAGAITAALEAEVQRLATQPPTPAELRAARRRLAGALARRCESNAGLASALGVKALFTAPGDTFDGALAAPLSVPLAEVCRVATTYLTDATFGRAILRPPG